MVKIKKSTDKGTPKAPETSKDIRLVKIPLSAAIFFSLLLVSVSFFLGTIVDRITGKENTQTTSSNTFSVTKSDKPEFNFFVMSFCPYGNQIETALRPVFDTIGNKVDIHPRYIFSKITDLKTSCKSMYGDVSQCALYVQNKYFPDEATCKKTVNADNAKCLDEKAYLKSGNTYYSSLHGNEETKQDVREICAYNLAEDKKMWWDFIANVNQSCNLENVASCWEEQAKKAGYDTNKINDCFNNQAVDLIEKEIALTDQYKVQGSPTLLINGIQFPPESAYTQDGKGTIAIGKKVYTQEQFRSPNTIKEAICAGFKKAPKECQKDIADTTASQANAAAANGAGCGN